MVGFQRNESGFTLIEMMIVMVIFGLLVAIAIPNFLGMASNAKEAAVKSNCHTVQIAAEDFSVLNYGIYPSDTTDTLPTGETIIDLLQGGNRLPNPWTGNLTEPVDGVASNKGETGYTPVQQAGATAGYVIEGFGRAETVISLSNG